MAGLTRRAALATLGAGSVLSLPMLVAASSNHRRRLSASPTEAAPRRTDKGIDSSADHDRQVKIVTEGPAPAKRIRHHNASSNHPVHQDLR